MEATSGWYPDPSGRFPLRFWDGAAWTDRAQRDGYEYRDVLPRRKAPALPGRPPPPVAPAPPATRTPVGDQLVIYLDDAFARGLLDTATHDRLRADAPMWAVRGAPAATLTPPRPASAPVAAPSVGPTRVRPLPPPPNLPAPPPPFTSASGFPPQPAVAPRSPTSPVTRPGVPAPATTAPGPVRDWWTRTRAGLSADLAVNGLAYLGTLLVFAGVFGFVVFAYQDVQAGLRPIAELSLPVAFFGAAWLLRRRGIAVVSAALELLGGAITPIVVIASLADGASPPPDLEDRGLLVALVASLVALALVYLVIALRRPTSTLRFLAAPTLWLAIAAAGLALAPTIPSGSAISHPDPAQWALVGTAITVTLLVCRWWRNPPGSSVRTVVDATVTAAIPAVVVAELVTILAAPGQAWPAAAMIVAGAATLTSLDLLDRRLPAGVVTAAQAVTLYATARTLAPALGAPTGGAVAGVGVIVLYELGRWRRPAVEPVLVAAVLIPGALLAPLIALDEPWPALVTFLVATTWAVGRRIRPGRPPVPGNLTATVLVLAPFGASSGLVRLTSLTATLLVVAAVTAAAAAAVRATSNRDPLWAGWIPGAAATVVVVSLVAGVADAGARPGWLAGATALATVALALAPRWPVLRVWSASAAAVTTLALVAMAWSWPTSIAALVLACLAFPLVAIAGWRREPIAGHLGVAGHLWALAATMVALGAVHERGWQLESVAGMATLALWTVGWALTAAVAATRGSSTAALIDRVLEARVEPVDEPSSALASPPAPGTRSPGLTASTAVAAASAPVLAALVAANAIGPSGEVAWPAVAGLATVLAEAVVARATASHRPEVARTVASTGLSVAIVALLVTATDDLAATVGAALVIAAVVAVGPIARREAMTWLAWAASLMVAVSGTAALGLPTRLLPQVVLGWGAVALVGSLALDDAVAGRRGRGEIIRWGELRPAPLLGSLALGTGLVASLGQEPAVAGWWWLVGAAATAMAAWQLRWGAITAVSFVLATVSYAMLAPWHPVEVPWTFVPIVAALVLLAEAVRTWWPAEAAPTAPAGGPELPADAVADRLPAWLTRWDQAPLVVAHVVAGVALVAAAGVDAIPATWCSVGVIALGLDARRRTGVWAAGGTTLVLVGAGMAGWGWLSLALAITAAATTAGAALVGAPARRVLQPIGVIATSASWATMLLWLVDLEAAVEATAWATAVLSLALATALRLPRPDRGWLVQWAVLVPIGLGFGTAAVVTGAVPGTQAGIAVGAALAASAIAAALSAAPAGAAALRDVAAVLLALSALVVGRSMSATPTQVVTFAGVVSVLATLAVSVAAAGRGRAPVVVARWVRPGLLLAGIATATSLLTAVEQLPERPLLVAALLLTGLDLAALGSTRRWSGALTVAPVPILAAWLVFASEALAGNPQWFTVPIGLTLLAIVALARRGERQAGHDPAAVPLVVLDLLGCLLVVAAALAQTVVDNVAYGVLAAALGAAIAMWGVLSRVRRRVELGAATITVAVALLVLVPLVGLLPNVTGPALWLALASIGLVAIVVAAFLEKGRAYAHRAVLHFGDATRDWEGWSAPHPPASSGA